ncbi:membrane protein [Microbacterium phage Barnstormer]|uniref:Membrane protein n=1 Tax=Microbacterium phage Barnstormer TaxID=3028491 RepID=A0AAE9ZM43_9CAUD|nr:membrane protein [Microbacterium phage Barnstormer]
MSPDTLGPLGWPLAGLAWAAFLLPYLAHWNRARRAARKAHR